MTTNQKTIGRRIFGLVMALAMVLAMVLPMVLPILTLFASVAGSTIDTSQTGSLTIYKYENSDELTEEGKYYTQAELKDLVDTALANEELTPMEDVVFSYLKVGDIAQSSVDSTTGEVTIGYSIDSNLKTLLETTGATLEVAFTDDDDSTVYYTTTSLQSALSKLTQTQAYNYISTNGGTAMEATGDDGKTEASGLELGLYLAATPLPLP